MTTQKPSHEESKIYIAALRFYRALVETAQTESRLLTGALRANAQRLLTHAACAGTRASAEAQQRSLRYARIATIKLFATIDAAWCERQVSDEEREQLRYLLGRALVLTEAPSKHANATLGAPSDNSEPLSSETRQTECAVDSTDCTLYEDHRFEEPISVPEGILSEEPDRPNDDCEPSLLATLTPAGSS
jgi:hypothetical protein